MPGKKHLGHGLCGNVVADELLKQFVAHDLTGVVSIEAGLLKIVAVLAGQVTT